MSRLYNTAKKAFFEPIKKALKGKKGSGEAIKNIGANVPKNKLDKLTRDVKVLEQKAKATKAMVDQSDFEIKNPQFTKGRFTFDPNRKNVTKESVKKRNKKSEEMFEASKGRKLNKGGRVGLKRGTSLTPKKSNVQKIKETFGPRGMSKNKKASKFGMLSVKAGIDKNPNPTQADRIAGAKMKNKKRFV